MKNKNHIVKASAPISLAIDEAVFRRQIEESYQKQQYAKMAKLAYEACTAFPDSWDFLYLCAEALYNDEQKWRTPNLAVLKKIEQICDVIIEASKDNQTIITDLLKHNYNPLTIRAFTLLRMGNGLASADKLNEARVSFLEAECYFMDALELAPDDLHALTGYGQTLERLGTEESMTDECFSLAKEHFLKGMTLDKEHGKAYEVCAGSYAMILIRNNEVLDALEILNSALEYCRESQKLFQLKNIAMRLLSGANPKPLNTVLDSNFNNAESKKIGFDKYAARSPVKTQSVLRPVLRVGDQAKL